MPFLAWRTFIPLSDRQLENLRAEFGRGVKKRNGRAWLQNNNPQMIDKEKDDFRGDDSGEFSLQYLLDPWTHKL